jgi:hypothetical protein
LFHTADKLKGYPDGNYIMLRMFCQLQKFAAANVFEDILNTKTQNINKW